MHKRRSTIIALLLIWLFSGGFTDQVRAATAKDKYISADACYRNLLKSENRKKYRENWFRCIEKFEAVYKHDTAGPWAAAGLYMTGKLYSELYRYSYKASDKREALDIFERVVKRYPKSRYRPRAIAAKKELSADVRSVKTSKKKTTRKKGILDRQYSDAHDCYETLLKNAKKQKYRDNWLKCINKFEKVYSSEPNGPLAAASLYMAGKLYDELSQKSYLNSDKQKARQWYQKLSQNFPRSEYAQKIQKATPGKTIPSGTPDTADEPPRPPDSADTASKDQIQKIIEDKTRQKPVSTAPSVKSNPGYSTVQGLRYWSNPSYTRVVIDADQPSDFTHRLLKKDPDLKKPQRLYIDLNQSKLGTGVQKTIPIDDNLLIDTRAGQYTTDTVRVVVDIKSFETYKIFSLRNPFRIVIDVWGETKKTEQGADARSSVAKSGEKIAPGSLAKQLALGVRRIVIDPGHGGKDFGAPGYLRGVHEKKIVLSIAKRLAEKIKKKLGYEAVLTRTSDRFLTLEERTAIANTKNADLFISIHTNSAKNRNAYGIETFFLNLATDEDAIRVAALENATSTKNISDLQTILSDLMKNAKINESSRLAGSVQKELSRHLKQRYSKVRNKGVKQAPFYVLLGAQMPAILIETSFISNPRECRRLINAKYQDQLCDGIINGIRKYVREISPRAYGPNPSVERPAG